MLVRVPYFLQIPPNNLINGLIDHNQEDHQYLRDNTTLMKMFLSVNVTRKLD